MLSKFLTRISMFSLLLMFACNQEGPKNSPSSSKIENDEDKTFYAMGVMLGMNLARLELTDKELSNIFKGVEDAAKGKKPEIEIAEYQPKIQEVFKARMEKVAKKQVEDGQKYLENFLKNSKAKKTESGLAYEIITEGTGKMPKSTDEVEVHYHGTLIDGTVFDSSVDRKQKISFPLDRVIKGWTEGLQLIKEGGKVKLVIPPDLAYGEAGAPPKIPGGATLVFEVELFRIIDKAAEAKAAEAAQKAAPAPKK
jgi:FKBP-type peptidyl-prolyl cis-trans isomerase FkpA